MEKERTTKKTTACNFNSRLRAFWHHFNVIRHEKRKTNKETHGLQL
ncbi:hypothetical protein AAZX31_02G065000 [Glycine max]